MAESTELICRILTSVKPCLILLGRLYLADSPLKSKNNKEDW